MCRAKRVFVFLQKCIFSDDCRRLARHFKAPTGVDDRNWAGARGILAQILRFCQWHALRLLITNSIFIIRTCHFSSWICYKFPAFLSSLLILSIHLLFPQYISKMTSHWICWDQLSQQIQPVPSPSGSRRLAQTFNDILGPAFQFWLIEPDQRHRSRI